MSELENTHLEKIVIIPTYNEKENIENIINAVFQLNEGFHILIIDDGSPDGTALIVKEIQKEFADSLFLVQRKGKLGLGTAYLTGFRWAIEKKYSYIFEMDADFSHNPTDLNQLYLACKQDGYDVAVGSRYVKNGGVINWPADRVFLSKGASLYTRLILWLPIKDSTAGFVVYKKEVLEAINLSEIKLTGYAFQIEMKFACWKLDFKIKEVPIIFQDRKFGSSKMNKGIIKEGVLGVLKLRWYSLFAKYRRKVKSNKTLLE